MKTEAPTTTTVVDRVTQDVAQFKPAEAKLAKYNEYLTYTINGIADKDGAIMVAAARKEVKAERVGLEHLRKAFVDDAVKYQAGVNGEARRIREQFEKIEAHLEAQEKKIADEKDRLARAEAEAFARKLDERKGRLFSAGMSFNGVGYAGHGELVEEHSVTALSDADFDAVVAKCETAAAAAKEREVVAAAAAALEAERMAEERRKLDEERAAMEAKKREQDAEARKIREDQEARERKIREDAEAVERAKRDAAEAEARRIRGVEEAKRKEEDRIATEDRITKEREDAARAERERIEQEAVERTKREEAERIEREAKMTDTAKLSAYCDALMAVPVPEMKSVAGKKKISAVVAQLEQIAAL